MTALGMAGMRDVLATSGRGSGGVVAVDLLLKQRSPLS